MGTGNHDTSLTIGKQSEAATTVLDSIEPLEDVLTTLVTTLEAEGPGLKGGPAVDLAQALGVWFQTGSQLGVAMQGYAQRLLAVDQTVNDTENTVTRFTGSALDGPR